MFIVWPINILSKINRTLEKYCNLWTLFFFITEKIPDDNITRRRNVSNANIDISQQTRER